MESYLLKEWFERLVALPILPRDSYGSPLLERGLATEALSSLMKRQRLPTGKRVELLNQSYWMGLIVLLEKLFPFVRYLSGVESFRSNLALPFLTIHPPELWSSKDVVAKFPDWIKSAYVGEDRERLLEAAMLNRACEMLLRNSQASSGHQSSQVVQAGGLSFSDKVALFDLDSNLFVLFKKFLTKPSQIEPVALSAKLEGGRCCGLLSCEKGKLAIEKIPMDQYLVLKALEQRATLQEAFECLGKGDKERARVSDQWQAWVSIWVQRGIISFQS